MHLKEQIKAYGNNNEKERGRNSDPKPGKCENKSENKLEF